MNPETIINIYTVLVVAVIALLLWLTIVWMKKPKSTAKLLSQSQENLTGLGAFLMALCSIGLSIGFSLSLATSVFIGVLFVSLFTGFCIAEFTASFHLAKAWNDGRLGRVGVAIFLLIGGAAISIIAGQALIAAKVDEAQAKRLQASEAYQLALNERKAAQAQVKSLAMDGSVVTSAKQKLAQFQAELTDLNAQKTQAVQARNACPPNYLKKCINPANQVIAELESKLSVLESSITKEQALISQFDQYQSAKNYAESLQNQPLPPTVISDSVLPGIKALAIVLGMSTEVVSAHVFLFLAVFGELGGIILFYLWGASRLERAIFAAPGGFTIDGEFTSSHSHQQVTPDIAQLTATLNLLNQKLAELENSKKM